MRKINQSGLDLIKNFEGCKLMAYQDSVGIWTIGIGHTPAQQGQVIDEAEALNLLASDCANAEAAVSRLVTSPLTDNQFSALVSFVFNLGQGTFKRSTLLTKLNAGDYTGAADEFLKWDKAGGKALPGLTDRRQAEKALFLT